MLKLGEKQTLKVVKEVEFGLYLASENPKDPDERVMLPIKQKPENIKIGDLLAVFIYRDSQDRLIATTNEPLITIGKVARLRIVETSGIGAFLDWGLEKDLFLPFREQTRKINSGENINVALYIDKSDRLCATMKLYPYLATNSPYLPNANVTGEIYEISQNFGAFVAIDDKYSALIPAKEIYSELKVGDIVTARISAIKPDGKIDLAIREKAYLKIDENAERILLIITNEYGGTLPFSDKTATPDQIRTAFNMSKNDFKRAVGNLLKANKINILNGQINTSP
ncbi:MAG: S1-like domain-containing RNA-binding protein [Lachnospiraceae bacterium]|nr:S1-like domain-containing RNA-binding protein [Lachnospiraceae bacterium]